MNSDIMPIIKDLELYKAILKGVLGNIPIVGGVVVELWSYFDTHLIDRRLKIFEETIYQRHIDIADFKNKLLELSTDEHKFYAVRNNLKYMFLSALPETVDVLNKSLIDFVMEDNYDMSEHACEIIRQLNSDDIYFLKLIISFQKEGKRDYQLKVTQEAQKTVKNQQDSLSKRKQQVLVIKENIGLIGMFNFHKTLCFGLTSPNSLGYRKMSQILEYYSILIALIKMEILLLIGHI